MTKTPETQPADDRPVSEILAEAAQTINGGPPHTDQATTPDPMQRGVRALRMADEDAMRLWKTAAPKDIKGEIAVYLVNREVIYLHQFPSGKFIVLREVKVADLMPEDDGE